MILQVQHHAHAVGDMAGQHAAVVDDGIHRADERRHRRQLVHISRHLLLAWHGHVGAAQVETAHGRQGILYLGLVAVDFSPD